VGGGVGVKICFVDQYTVYKKTTTSKKKWQPSTVIYLR
jgi:hypothetical protein